MANKQPRERVYLGPPRCLQSFNMAFVTKCLLHGSEKSEFVKLAEEALIISEMETVCAAILAVLSAAERLAYVDEQLGKVNEEDAKAAIEEVKIERARRDDVSDRNRDAAKEGEWQFAKSNAVRVVSEYTAGFEETAAQMGGLRLATRKHLGLPRYSGTHPFLIMLDSLSKTTRNNGITLPDTDKVRQQEIAQGALLLEYKADIAQREERYQAERTAMAAIHRIERMEEKLKQQRNFALAALFKKVEAYLQVASRHKVRPLNIACWPMAGLVWWLPAMIVYKMFDLDDLHTVKLLLRVFKATAACVFLNLQEKTNVCTRQNAILSLIGLGLGGSCKNWENEFKRAFPDHTFRTGGICPCEYNSSDE